MYTVQSVRAPIESLVSREKEFGVIFAPSKGGVSRAGFYTAAGHITEQLAQTHRRDKNFGRGFPVRMQCLIGQVLAADLNTYVHENSGGEPVSEYLGQNPDRVAFLLGMFQAFARSEPFPKTWTKFAHENSVDVEQLLRDATIGLALCDQDNITGIARAYTSYILSPNPKDGFLGSNNL